jgi:hypothetical protein
MTDAHVAALLEELTPGYDDRAGDWERVVADARRGTQRRVPLASRWRVGALAVAVATTAALVLAWPFAGRHDTLLGHALAAVGNGPVLHAVLRGEWGGTLVDLSTGARKAVYGDDEFWFDIETGRTHEVVRLGGVVQDEELSTPEKPAAELAALGRDYRRALESGTARVAGEDTLDGTPIVWITIRSELLPDVADGKDHEWAQQIAVSKHTYEPVALRETRDGKPGPDTLQRVLGLELIGRDPVDFTRSRPSLDGTAFKQGREPISRAQAATVLGRPPLWLGESYNGLPLAQVYRETTVVGRQRRVRLTGAKAAAATRCSRQRGTAAGDCFRRLGLESVEVRPDGVFTSKGPIRWQDGGSGLVLWYGAVGVDPGARLDNAVPLYGRPYVALTESNSASSFRRGAGSYVPPAGSVFLAAGGTSGYLQRGGTQVGVEAGSESAVLSAARALAPMP